MTASWATAAFPTKDVMGHYFRGSQGGPGSDYAALADIPFSHAMDMQADRFRPT
jgi:hypothetical protein